MKIPQRPPSDWTELLASGPVGWQEVLSAVAEPTVNGQYVHWDKLRHLQPPDELSVEQWWGAIKFRRATNRRPIPLSDRTGRPFDFIIVDPMTELLHKIDQNAGGIVRMTEPIIEKASADRYAVRSLMEEAITSSQIEGALTTRRVAKDMIRSGRPPRDTSERMILNNYRAMQKITDFEGKVDLSKEVVLDLHRVLTSDTMEEPSAVARFRRRGELIRVMDPEGQVMHDPPATDELPERFARMCAFANGTEPDFFIHPVVRSIILHFWLAYDHPFVDGNGRCARALFYWSMLRHGYWLCEFISISEVIKKAYAQYGRAFLHTETDDNDLTYFILYHLNLIDRAVEQLHQYIDRKTEQQQVLDRLLRRTADINHRQKALLSHALRHPDAEYTIRSHMTSHDVSYETSRKDLMDLEGRNLLESLKVGREFVFVPVDELERRVRSL